MNGRSQIDDTFVGLEWKVEGSRSLHGTNGTHLGLFARAAFNGGADPEGLSFLAKGRARWSLLGLPGEPTNEMREGNAYLRSRRDESS